MQRWRCSTPERPTVLVCLFSRNTTNYSCYWYLHQINMLIFRVFALYQHYTGTIFAGFSVFCCANKGQDPAGRVSCLCINFWVGILQMGTVWFFLLGWIWSIMWGAAFLGMSGKYCALRRYYTPNWKLAMHLQVLRACNLKNYHFFLFSMSILKHVI